MLLEVGIREVVVPDRVFREVEDPALPGQLPGWDPSSLPIRREPDVPVPPEVLRHALDPGESMVLALALVLRADGNDVEVVLDERRPKGCLGLGLPVVGTAGLLVLAKLDGRIKEVAPVLDQLERVGMYLGAALRNEILAGADE